MVKLILVSALLFVNQVLACRWVCIDKNNNIKKTYFDKRKFKVEYSLPIIEVPASPKHIWKNFTFAGQIPEVTLRMPAFEVQPMQVSCNSKTFAKTVKEITRKIKCAPRDTIVDIVYAGAKVTPNKVSTKLCRGVCSGSNKACLSVERKNVSLSIRTILNDGKVECATVTVPEDTKCKCDCDITQSDCLSTQIFDKKFCKCKCINEEEYKNCMHKIKHSIMKKHTWNKDVCSCECLQRKVCTTGTIWNENECKCIRTIS
ncbi:hypothetical protein NQ318_002744 [Aromia moschata]|uniref:Platelet-derived growth factor (PDGF) family profile domain-containing protein n=1 Tax=Aromia moschata TaxID=1265417 RepID=A0AAV8Y3M9_9CUCU|nr:hypothetical protein NQ318_002744 [Aromia moschata]